MALLGGMGRCNLSGRIEWRKPRDDRKSIRNLCGDSSARSRNLDASKKHGGPLTSLCKAKANIGLDASLGLDALSAVVVTVYREVFETVLFYAALLKELLEMDGHTVHLAHDGAEALKVIRHNTPDLALLDIGMASDDGYGVARMIRADLAIRNMVLTAVTGWGAKEDLQRSREA